MSTYKLTYFNVRARAELIRFVFAQAGVEYEDVRVSWDQWQELKPSKFIKFFPKKLGLVDTQYPTCGPALYVADPIRLQHSHHTMIMV